MTTANHHPAKFSPAIWHLDTLADLGLAAARVEAKGNRLGANRAGRVGYEYVYLLCKANDAPSHPGGTIRFPGTPTFGKELR